MMKPTVFVISLIALEGCSSGKPSDLNACLFEADRFYQGFQTDDVNNPRSRYIIECMASKGYDFDISPAQCDSRRSLPTQESCFVSSGWLARIIDKI